MRRRSPSAFRTKWIRIGLGWVGSGFMLRASCSTAFKKVSSAISSAISR